MAARKDNRPIVLGAQAGDDAVGAGGDIGRLLAVRASVAKETPA